MPPLTAPPAPEWPALLARWTVEAPVVALLVLAALAYAVGRRKRAAGPGAPAFAAGMAVLGVALLSPVATYAHALLSAHMVQHLLLVLVAAPLIVAAHPAPSLLAAVPDAMAVQVASLGRSRLARLATHPLVAWLAFAVTGWAVHFSPLFDAALEHPILHAAEHALFLGSGLLFWHPVLAEGPGTLSSPLRLLYLALAMPQNTFLALAILSADHPLYEAYVRLGRDWGPSVLDDQRQAGGVMWIAGDLALLVAVLVVAGAWARSDRTREDEAEEAAADTAADVSAGSAGPPPSPRTAG
jgi:putative membrane protein